MNTRFPLLALALVVTLFTGCRIEQATPEADPLTDTGAEVEVLPPPLPDPSPIDATSVIDHRAAGDATTRTGGVDTRAIAGRFSNGDTLLELREDGTYVQTLKVGGAALTATGTWSAIGPAALLLDPSSKSAQDAVFLVASTDELNSEDGALTFHRIVAP